MAQIASLEPRGVYATAAGTQVDFVSRVFLPKVGIPGEVSLEDLPEAMAGANRRYARRQLRWLRRDPRIQWFDAQADPVPGILAYLEERLR